MRTMNEEKMNRYLQHLDRDGLIQLIKFLLTDSTSNNLIIAMSDEWDKMYGSLKEGDER